MVQTEKVCIQKEVRSVKYSAILCADFFRLIHYAITWRDCRENVCIFRHRAIPFSIANENKQLSSYDSEQMDYEIYTDIGV